MIRTRKFSFLFLIILCFFATSFINVTAKNLERKVGNIQSWSDLKNTVKNASKGSTIILNNDIITDDLSDRVVIDKKNITIDLNGYDLKKVVNYESYKNGHIFEIQGDSNVTITDSYGGSELSYGCGKNGGAINIHDGSTLTMNNVTISSNRASGDGGAIFNRGHLILNNCQLLNNLTDGDGGAINNTGDGWFEINNCTFYGNYSADDGGAINANMDETSTIRNTHFQSNKSKDDGGGIHLDAEDETLNVYNSTFYLNQGEEGGGIYVYNGKMNLYGCIIKNNLAEYGGGIYNYEDLEIMDASTTTEIFNNVAYKEGGGVFVRGETIFRNYYIHDNLSYSNGGGIYCKNTKLYLEGGKIQYNKSRNSDGGGIYVYDAKLYIHGAEISYNECPGFGGGLFCNPEMDNLYASGRVIINNNLAGKARNLCISNRDTLELDGPLSDGSKISFAIIYTKLTEDDEEFVYYETYDRDMCTNLTDNYSDYHGNTDPNNYFISSEGYLVELKKGEVWPTEDRTGYEPEDPAILDKDTFIPWNEQIETDVTKLCGNNWLSGVSGERRLNEINTPITHDSSMAEVASGTDCIGTWVNSYSDAVTQYLYIYEQLEAGIRGLDLRVSNKRVWKKGRSAGDQSDDGVNLFMCHGTNNAGGTYYAEDPETGYPLNFLTVLEWVENFLAAHPTEYVKFNLDAECQHGYDKDITFQRLEKILREHINDINPATGESYFYLEDGIFGKEYTEWPKLKDVRGKIVIHCEKASQYGATIGGVVQKDFYGKYYYAEQGGKFSDSEQIRVYSIQRFDRDYLGQINLPTDASPIMRDGKPLLYQIGTNCTGESTTILGDPSDHPYILADYVNMKVYGEDGVFGPQKTGTYIGWVSSDAVSSYTSSLVWKTNFFDGLDYKTITIKSNKPGIEDQVFKLLKGSEITIPGYIYDYPQNENNGYFNGWMINDNLYQEGDKYIVNYDTVINANWIDTAQEVTRIKIIWKDIDNKDNLRSDVSIKINGNMDFNITNNNWSRTLPVLINSLDITWNNAINNVDDTNSYRYIISGDNENGWAITFIHTPSDQITIEGKVLFCDNGKYYRPSFSTYGIYEKNSDVLLSQREFSSWAYASIGSDTKKFDPLPKYRDGEEIEYEMRFISARKYHDDYFDLSKYDLTIVGYSFKYYLKDLKDVNLNIYWVDIDIIDDLNVEFRNINDDIIDSYLSFNIFENDNLSVYSFALAATKNEDGLLVVNLDNYEIIIEEKEDVHFNIYRNEYGYYVVASPYEYSNDYDLVIKYIDLIGDVTSNSEYVIKRARKLYELLSAESKELVTNYDVLVAAENKYNNLIGANMASVVTQIALIHDVTYTPLSNMLITRARASYNKLTEVEQMRITKYYNILVAAETKYKELEKIALDRQKEIDKVIELIDEIGEVDYNSSYSYSNIDEARSAYELLDLEQQEAVNNYDELISAESIYYSEYFINEIDDIYNEDIYCDDHKDELDELWPNLKSSWDDLETESQELIVDNNNEYFNQFINIYSNIMGRYTYLDSFQNGPSYVIELKEILLSGDYKTKYYYNESLDLNGLVVTAYYYDGTSKIIDDYNHSEFDNKKLGNQNILINYTENGITKTASFEINVIKKSNNNAVIIGIVVGSIILISIVGISFIIIKKKKN